MSPSITHGPTPYWHALPLSTPHPPPLQPPSSTAKRERGDKCRDRHTSRCVCGDKHYRNSASISRKGRDDITPPQCTHTRDDQNAGGVGTHVMIYKVIFAVKFRTTTPRLLLRCHLKHEEEGNTLSTPTAAAHRTWCSVTPLRSSRPAWKLWLPGEITMSARFFLQPL